MGSLIRALSRALSCNPRCRLPGRAARRALQTFLHALAVLSAQPLGELAAHAALLHLQLHQWNSRQRLAIDAPGGETALVDARSGIRLTQRLVGERRPALDRKSVV